MRDDTITFRLQAAGAKRVQVFTDMPKLDAVPSNGSAGFEMTKDANGVWSFTTPKLRPSYYQYWFVVDGFSTPDPQNTFVRPASGVYKSMVALPGKEADFMMFRDVPHGDLIEHHYFNKEIKVARRVVVYTPPDYTTQQQEISGGVPAARPQRFRARLDAVRHGQQHHGQPARGQESRARDHRHALRPRHHRRDRQAAGDPRAAEGVGTTRRLRRCREHELPSRPRRGHPVPTPRCRDGCGRCASTGLPAQLNVSRLDHGKGNARLRDPLRREGIPRHQGSGSTAPSWVTRWEVVTAPPSASGIPSCSPPWRASAATAPRNLLTADPAKTNKNYQMIFIGSGTEDTAVNGGRTMHQALENAGIQHIWSEDAGYGHDYQIWRQYLYRLLQQTFRE